MISFIEPFNEEEGVARARALFTKAYIDVSAPSVSKKTDFSTDIPSVWAAPGRVNIIGEHTDYNAGLCLPIALPHRTFVALRARNDTHVRVVSSVAPDCIFEVDLEDLQPGQIKGWGAYPVGVAWALRRCGFSVKGFDAAFVSCVPLGSGLSSSAAMTCSTALALDDTFGLGLSDSDEGRIRLIDAAIAAENEMAGASTGGLDQNASLRCRKGFALLLDCMPGLRALDSVSQQTFDLKQYGLSLLVVDTCAPHQLNDGQYASRRRMCEAAADALGVSSLRVVADSIAQADDPGEALATVLARVNAYGGDTMMRRVRHVLTEIARVRCFVDAFAAGDIRTAGALMNASHDSLRDDYEVTVAELDVAVDTARREGAYGARMTGGGFGGSMIALVDEQCADRIAQAIADAFQQHGFAHPRALVALASAAGARCTGHC